MKAMKKVCSAPAPSEKRLPVIYPDVPVEFVLVLVDLLWMAAGQPPDVPS